MADSQSHESRSIFESSLLQWKTGIFVYHEEIIKNRGFCTGVIMYGNVMLVFAYFLERTESFQ